MSIKPLPGDVVAQIRSSVVITSLNDVVCGLIKNSLDAEATRINVTVDYARGNCFIEDDGAGIPPSEFKEGGGLGQLHHTSKFPLRQDVHGKHGVFLASVAALSLLSITSRHRDFQSQNSMTIHKSLVLTRQIPSLPEQRLVTFDHGTRLVVRDLFGSMPVRVKHRALQADRSGFGRDWTRLIVEIVAILIAWPNTVSISIRDSSSRQDLSLQTSPRLRPWVKDSCCILYQASLCDSPDAGRWVSIGASSPTLAISGFVCRDPIATKRVQFISLGVGPLSNESRCNVLYEEVNKIFAESSFGTLEDDGGPADVDKKRDGFTAKELRPRKGVDRWPMFFLKLSPVSAHGQDILGVDEILDDRQPSVSLITDLLRAMFYEFLRKIHCQPRQISLHTSSTSHEVNHGSAQTNANEPDRRSEFNDADNSDLGSCSEPARKTPRLDDPRSRAGSLFAAPSRIKAGRPLQTFQTSPLPEMQKRTTSTIPSHDDENNGSDSCLNNRPAMIEFPQDPLFDRNGRLMRKPFEDIQNPEKPKFEARVEAANKPEVTSSQISNDCQNKIPESIEPATRTTTNTKAPTASAKVSRRLTLSTRHSEAKVIHHKSDSSDVGPELGTPAEKESTPWIRDLAGKWRNPVFRAAEAPIPKLPEMLELPDLELRPGRHQTQQGPINVSASSRHEALAIGLQGRLSKDTLKRAQVISQIDNKFILAKFQIKPVSGEGDSASTITSLSPVLVLIDQHAADERCRVEGLMRGYFRAIADETGSRVWAAVTQLLPKPMQFEVSITDRDVLSRFQQHLRYWGIYYSIRAPTQTNTRRKDQSNMPLTSKAMVSVQSLPPAILERCRTEPRLLVELMRKEAWRLNDEGTEASPPIPIPVSQAEPAGDGPAWVSLFHGCPPGIVDLINSRSCRSAIMFNDPLSAEECSALLDRLVECAFPFQCAHGRPSMVPVVDLGQGMSQLGGLAKRDWVEEEQESFGEAMRKWKDAS